MAQHPDFLGTGWRFPPEFEPGIGALLSSGERDIRESLEILFQTTVGERFLQPKFGLDMHELLFEPLNTTATALLEDRVRVAILLYEPRVDLLSLRIRAAGPNGQALLEVDCVVRSTNSRFNLVHPFYSVDASEADATGRR
jgi:phage baseplate assembly protein W